MLNTLKKIIRKNDFAILEEDLEQKSLDYMQKIQNDNYDFSIYKKQILSQGKKKRIVYSYPKNSVENVLCGYLKNELDKKFNVRYPNRNKIINILFNTLPVVKDLNDFCIIRFDFKSFFDSVLTKHIYDNYIEQSSITRRNKAIFKHYTQHFKYCYAGLNLSNTMTEITCRDFDKVLRAKLDKYGVVYCERYVDDVLIILNSYLSRSDFIKLLDNIIKEVFMKCNIKINNSKSYYIARRSLRSTQAFDFLGYNFTLDYRKNGNNDEIIFKYGITKSKQIKYKGRIRQTFIEYKKNKDIELLRHRIKATSTRIVYSMTLNEKSFDWVTKGVVSNYNELRYHLDSLDTSTENFLKNIYFDLMDELNITYPYFISKFDDSSIYNLFSTMQRNRSMIFDEKIGLRINQLVALVRKLDHTYDANRKTYYQITKDYLELLKIQ